MITVFNILKERLGPEIIVTVVYTILSDDGCSDRLKHVVEM
jgi:hypothetical protein